MTGTTNPDHPKFLRPPLDAYSENASTPASVISRLPDGTKSSLTLSVFRGEDQSTGNQISTATFVPSGIMT
jgi:hypothetical protein